jgi:hypothetical protein
MRTAEDDVVFWSLVAEDHARIIRDQANRIEALEDALLEIMAAVRNEEWDEAPPHIYEIARAALAPEQDK